MYASISHSPLLRVLKRWLRRDVYIGSTVPTSSGCEIVSGDVQPELLRGWQDPLVAQRQEAAFAPVLQQMREGHPRQDFAALAAAIELTDAQDPLIVEVGCASAWNAEVLARLWRHAFRYMGVDYSAAMIALAKQRDPRPPCVVGDAMALPLRDRSCDILLSGTVLMHLMGYQTAIQESRRVTRRWCVFHTVPVVTKRPTTILKKFAYGQAVVEVVFNADEFPALLRKHGLRVSDVLQSIPHGYLNDILLEPVTARTYVCEVN